jgi:hypothetical protein
MFGDSSRSAVDDFYVSLKEDSTTTIFLLFKQLVEELEKQDYLTTVWFERCFNLY